MLVIGKIENKVIVLSISLLFIVLIGYLDYITGEEMSFSIFYLIPICLLALYRSTNIYSVIICSVFASILWFLVEFISREYSNIFIAVWNGFVRLTIFITIGLLILYQKEKHKKLNLLNSNLKVLNEEKNKFIGIAAHDMRTPINGIYSFSELLIDNYENNIPPEVLEIILHIKTISSNALVIFQNLLNVSQIESGKVELKQKKQDYISFVKGHISLNQIIARKKNINIFFETQAESIITEFDEHYLSEVIDNLLSNAIKYSDNYSEIIVKISLRDNRQILTEVIDKGKGIPYEEQQKLFNYFQTTSTRPTAGEQSNGLGLAIAKQIVVLHNGEIGVNSSQNEGSNFYFSLPINN